MERSYKNDFERFLKDNADQYRLYPSEKVWKGVYSSLHTRRKWYGIGILLLLLTGTLITLLITNSSKKSLAAANEQPAASNKNLSTDLTVTDKPKKHQGFRLPAPASTVLLQQEHELPAAVEQDNLLTAQNNIRPLEPATISENGMSTPARTGPVLQSPPVTSTATVNLSENKLNSFSPTVTDNSPEQQWIRNTVSFEERKTTPANAFNWTIESVVNNFQNLRNSRKKHVELQLNFTPTISYRKLSENKSFIRSSAARNTPYTYAALYNVDNYNINNAVTHRPDLGLELGLTGKYSLNKTIKIKAGLQFNISRYDIKAFYYPFDVATIALNTGGGVDSVRTVTEYRNFNGYTSNWLQNYYFQVSMPVGVEVKLAGDNNVQFGIAGSLQPTYMLGDRAYLLSTDYKNYAEIPWLIRHWNVNTALETYVSYSTGKLKWQVGPQVRYQLRSSFIDKYPVKENLFDFGLKLGISLNNNK